MPQHSRFGTSLRKLGETLRDLPKPTATAVSAKNAADWNKPGGGYDQWKKGDAAREKALPIGGIAPETGVPLKEKKPLKPWPRGFGARLADAE